MAVSGDAAPSGRYQRVSGEKAGGATYTPGVLSDFVAARMVEVLAQLPQGRRLRVLDPGVGEGELLLSLLSELQRRGVTDVDVHAFETDAAALAVTRQRLEAVFPQATLHMIHGSFLDYALAQPDDQAGQGSAYFDLVIANPPYIRTQVLGAVQARWLASQFGLKGRVDMYHAFVAGIARVLHVGGMAGLIVSNRFMSTRSGAVVRAMLRRHFRIRHVWDLGDTRLFDTAVLPAVLLLERGSPEAGAATAGFVSAYEAVGEPGEKSRRVPDAIAALTRPGLAALPDGRQLRVTHGKLDAGIRPQDNWRIATGAGDDWLRTVAAHTWKHFGNLGKIRVGVKTCADKVFIRQDWQQAVPGGLPELLRPLTTHHIARRFRAEAPARQILYPHGSLEGRRIALDLEQFPRSAAYLEQHRATLAARSYVTEGGRHWYEIWVPQDPARWALPKLVFRDIAEAPTFWVDLEGSVVNGDCYWLAAETPEAEALLWLAAAVANSSFIERFYDENFQNKLYAGRRRFITQYVERFPLPDPDLPLSQEIAAAARRIHELAGTPEAEVMERELDQQVWRVFGVGSKKAGR
ncbi:Eco57I restriction-modification methylase domain-containing protein [Kerstersia gyiorum]|uniref:site-specific DNA-methyltransferase (adenine-specific) n=2 Tax=Kerstersia gyiorum TaxID=206506 RepID=A0A4Q7MPF1_9BURK|nr:N-6 DNA methylase [Kerstersia gyiorum]MCO7636526.1 N-6 DNA methylase [Pseudomonas sp. S 311-6]KAB0543706.1 N-6 DNA methylase [Kerstersia gyiorum]MCP1634655.1 hypothetical protein [Kerstersia gyiorum]MCP1636987.1 hypothetical protein [Kerstersia gyiorum]MCP1678883.1 hypothetical protein [Kerstersia gyiorum]